VIDVDEQDQIQLGRGEPRIRFRSEDRFDVREVLSSSVSAQTIEHARLNVVGVDDSPRRHPPSNSQAVEAGSRANIADEHAGLQVERGERLIGLLLSLTLLAIKPVRSAHAHNRSNAPSSDGMNSLGERATLRAQEDTQYADSEISQPAITGLFHGLRFRFSPQRFDSKKTIRPARCGYDDRRTSCVWLAGILAALVFGLPGFCAAADSTLAVVDAGVQQSEDAPVASSGFRFLPGDYLYFTFQISGFGIQSEKRGEVRKISLSYDVRPEDTNGIPLTAPSSGSIETELNAEDKNWSPKRRASFLIPSFIGAGDFHIHVVVKDAVAKSEATKDIPFHIGGLELQPASAITTESFHFLRNENEDEPLEVAAYAPGDTVYARFEMVGFKTGRQNAYHLSYGITVLRPDGKPYLQEPKAAELADSSFYPAQYLPGDLTVTTSATSARGQYVVIVTVRDLIANTSYETRKAFSIE